MKKRLGFTLIELILVIAILGILSAIAIPSYQSTVEKTAIALAVTDISKIEAQIERYYIVHGVLPVNLNNFVPGLDPWGNPYGYLDMSTTSGNGQKRKDRNLVPLNTDYDLYSKGPDGLSVSPLTAAKSKDDIIRANNGGFVGKAEDY